MAVTDLTNTTWIIHDSYSSIFDYDGGGSYYIDFTDADGTSFISIEFVASMTIGATDYPEVILYNDGVQSQIVAVDSGSFGYSDSYKTIHISGGDAVESSSLIAGLGANATQVIPEPEYVDKVSLPSGDEYYIKDTVSGYLTKEDILSSGSISISETSEGRLSINDISTGIAGRFIRFHAPTPTITNLTNTMWALKSDSELAGASISTTNSFNINFTAESGDYVGIIFSPSSSSSNVLKIGLNYDSEYTEGVYDGAWYNNDYRVILINSGDDASNSELISLLSRYAYQINIDVTSSADVILEFNSTLNFYNLASGTLFDISCTTYDGSSGLYINIIDGGLSYNDGGDSVSQVVYNSSSGGVDERGRRITISNIDTRSHDSITCDLGGAILNSTVVS